jgi:hypothetical protein
MDNLNELNHPARFAEIASLHTKAFNWEPQNCIPLGIHVVNPEYGKGLDYHDWLNPEPIFELQRKVLIDTLQVGSDLLPVVAINHLGDAVLTSMFGAQMLMPETSSATLQDIGPTPIPPFSSIKEVAGLDLPGLDAGIMPEVRRIVRYYRARLPSWVHLVAPMPGAPFSAAMELRGSDFILDLYDHPEECRHLIDLCARLQVEVEQDVRSLSGAALDQHVTNFGILGTGLRLGEDTMVNLSPSLIREFCFPAFACVNHLGGGRGHVHFCTLEHRREEFIYPLLAETSEVAVASTQFGFEYYAAHLNELRGRLAIESFYGDAVRYVRNQYGSFKAWANDFVPRFQNESGLVLYCQVASIQEGLDMWNAWKEAHAR